MNRIGTMAVIALLAGAASSAHAAGPDAYGGDLNGIASFGAVGDISAYSLGPTTCNVGTAFLGTHISTADHPVIAQNLYRLHNGRFEQIGMSWAFHTLCSLQGTVCSSCTPPPGGGCNNELGIGCSTSDSSAFAGNFQQLGPRSQVNAATGAFPFPFTAPTAPATIGRRLQVHQADLNPATHAGASFFAELVYVSADDAAAGNAFNNGSHRKVIVSGVGPYSLTYTGHTTQGLPAIYEWQLADPGVMIASVDVPGDGRFLVGSRATPVGCNRYRYEYAVFNLSSDRSMGALEIPTAIPASATSIGFHDVDYHSGEPYSGADWTSSTTSCGVSWSTESFAANPNANALRWGTLYNFSFESPFAPADQNATLGLFKPGVTASMPVLVAAPGTTPAFAGDYDGSGAVGLSDVAFVISNWNNSCGTFGLSAVADVIMHWANTCP
ncbi:MAG TPA: hypothetical protein VG797_11890 [Phycisphaerales bacterium]|nr:hypothetical protein [Phycisphaerales bacterium]